MSSKLRRLLSEQCLLVCLESSTKQPPNGYNSKEVPVITPSPTQAHTLSISRVKSLTTRPPQFIK